MLLGNTYTYDQRNRLLTGAGTSYNWSPRGTLASTVGTGAATYNHDGLDGLTQAGTVTYAYDSLDRVTTRTVGGTTTGFSYAGTETDPVAEGAATKYLRTPTGQSLHAMIRAGVFTIAGTDRHDDVTFTLSTTGAVVDSKVSDPFGKPIATTGSAPNIGFQSDYTDPTSGLVWMGARWYNPATATFTARDTYPGAVGANTTLNRYTYGLNNPLSYNDPTGHSSEPVCDNACLWAQYQNTGDIGTDHTYYENEDGSFNSGVHVTVGDNGEILVTAPTGVVLSTATQTGSPRLTRQPIPC